MLKIFIFKSQLFMLREREMCSFDTFLQVEEFIYMNFSSWIYNIRSQTMISIEEKSLL